MALNKYEHEARITERENVTFERPIDRSKRHEARSRKSRRSQDVLQISIEEIIELQPESHRDVIRLRIEGYNVQEIADIV